jgi:hypothetical protein
MASILTNPNSTQKLANYLKTFINERFAEEIALPNSGIPSGTTVIKSVRNYDDPSVPLSDFPLLKVYKNRDIFRKGTLFRNTQGTITYAVSYPQLQVLPNLLDWLSYQINNGLLNYEMAENDLLPPPNDEGYVGEFLISANELTREVHPFLRFQINFKNFCDSQNYQI